MKQRETKLHKNQQHGGSSASSKQPKPSNFLDMVLSLLSLSLSQTPLESSSVDVSVFCLSLMGTNYSSYINEAHRVLRPSGWLLIAEVKSRFDPNNGGADPKDFVKAVCNLGFTSVLKDFSSKMFILLHFQKKEQSNSNEKKIEWPKLKACLYKRRCCVNNGRSHRVVELMI